MTRLAARLRAYLDARPCRCGHTAGAHRHWRQGRDCGACGQLHCPRFRRRRRRDPASQHWTAAGVLHLVLAAAVDQAMPDLRELATAMTTRRAA